MTQNIAPLLPIDGLEITAGERKMPSQIKDLTRQTLTVLVILTGLLHFFVLIMHAQ